MKATKGNRYFLAVRAFGLALAFFAAYAVAQTPLVLKEHTPVNLWKTGFDSRTFQPSAVEPIGDGTYLLVANDKPLAIDKNEEKETLLVVRTSNGEIVRGLSIPAPKDKPGYYSDPKWEAMAKDGDNYYLIGAHRNESESRFIRFRLISECENEPSKFEINKDSVREFKIETLPSGEVKIEGLAVRTVAGTKELVVGFRKPTDKGRVQFHFAELKPDNNLLVGVVTLSLKLPVQFDAGTPKGTDNNVWFELSSIEYVSVKDLEGFLVITSTEYPENTFHGNALWFVSNKKVAELKSAKPGEKVKDPAMRVVVKELEKLEKPVKGEGICVLPATADGKLRIVIVYDNDGKDAGKMQILELSGSPK